MIRTFTGWHMAAITISFFAVIIAVNITLAVYAKSSWTGLVVENSYVASQNFNHDAQIARQQQAVGWQMKLSVKRDVANVEIYDRSHHPLTGLSLVMVLQRPTSDTGDSSDIMQEKSSGRYSLEKVIATGVWIVDVTAAGADHKPIRFVNRVIVN